MNSLFIKKNKRIFLPLARNFFFLGLIFLFLENFTEIIISQYLNITFITTLTILLAFFWLFFYTTKKHEPFFKYPFLLILTLIAANSFFDLQIISTYMFPLSIFTFGFGFFTFYFNKKDIEKKIKDEEIKDFTKEKEREESFKEKFKIINKIPVLGWIFKKIYKQGFWPILILILILSLFTYVKYPYFEMSFTGHHTMKYNSYVEPAKYMYEEQNPFLYQKKYHADPVTNPIGLFKSFDSIPFVEWGLLTTLTLFPENSLELNARLFTHMQGILILILAYVFFSKWFSKKLSLFITFLISINPIFNFLSFVTVEDSILLISTFASLIYLSEFIKSSKFKDLFWAGLIFGLGTATKYSLFLWLAPMSFALLAFHSKTLARFLKNYSIFIFFSLTPILIFRSSIRNLPNDSNQSLITLFISILILIAIYFILKKYNTFLEKVFKKVTEKKLYLLFLIILVIISGAFFIKFAGLTKLSQEFLTDSSLILNWQMYSQMLGQFKSYTTTNVFSLGIAGLLITFFLKSRDSRIIIFTFLAGALVYWIMASKVIFFHNYYTGIIMIFFAIVTGLLFYSLSKLFNNTLTLILTIILMFALVFPSSYETNLVRLSSQKNVKAFEQVANFLIENTKEDDMYIDTGYLLTLTLMTGRPRTTEGSFNQPEIIESIQEEGFKKTFEDYKISYLITHAPSPNYEYYFNLLTKDEKKIEEKEDSVRKGLIQSRAGNNFYVPEIITSDEEDYPEDFINIFVLEETFGPYRIYSFSD